MFIALEIVKHLLKEILMFTFILVLILVFIGVDLLVRFVIDPLAAGSHKKNKKSKSYTPGFDPTIRLASETMYDGGEIHKEDELQKIKKEDQSMELNSDIEK